MVEEGRGVVVVLEPAGAPGAPGTPASNGRGQLRRLPYLAGEVPQLVGGKGGVDIAGRAEQPEQLRRRDLADDGRADRGVGGREHVVAEELPLELRSSPAPAPPAPRRTPRPGRAVRRGPRRPGAWTHPSPATRWPTSPRPSSIRCARPRPRSGRPGGGRRAACPDGCRRRRRRWRLRRRRPARRRPARRRRSRRSSR